MLLLISDASVLIDIECGGLSDSMFALSWQFAVPDILFFEELETRHAHLLNLGLIIKKMSGELLLEAYKFRQQFFRTSFNDLLALVLAKHENCQLLTGDKALKNVAQKFKIETHGTIWLVEKLIQHEIITVTQARRAFQKMQNAGSRLPKEEIEKMLDRAEMHSLQEA